MERRVCLLPVSFQHFIKVRLDLGATRANGERNGLSFLPTTLRSDPGTEFANKDVRAFLKRETVNYFETHTIVKAFYTNIAIKLVKGRLVRYMTRQQTQQLVHALADITEKYNIISLSRELKKA